MKYVLLFAGTMEGVDRLPGAEREAAMADYEKSSKWFEKYYRAGKIVDGHELQGPSTAKTVTHRDGRATVTDGPFIESKEIIGGYAVVEVANVEEAIAMASEWPGTIEIRPIVDHSQDRERALGAEQRA